MCSIVILEENIESLRKLSTEDLGILMKAIMDDSAGEEPDTSNFSFVVELLYPIIQGSVARMRKTSAVKSEAGRAGGRPKKQDEKQSEKQTEKQDEKQSEKPEPNRTEPNHTEPNRTVPNRTKIEEVAPLPPEIDSPQAAIEWENFVKLRKEKRKPLTDRAKGMIMKDLVKFARGDPDRAVKILQQSIRKGWTDIYDLKEPEANFGRIVNAVDWEAI